MAKHTNGEIKIERGVQTPGLGRKSRYPWKEMEIGDSFVVPNGVAIEGFRRSAHAQLGRGNYMVRKSGRHYRCWRIA